MKSILIRFLFFSLLWLVISEAALSALWVGLPVVLICVFISLKLMPPIGFALSPFAWLRFIQFFLVQSVKSGFDVAKRAVSTPVNIHPCFREINISLKNPFSRVLFAVVVSLLPGTLSVDLNEKGAYIHALEEKFLADEQFEEIESILRPLFHHE